MSEDKDTKYTKLFAKLILFGMFALSLSIYIIIAYILGWVFQLALGIYVKKWVFIVFSIILWVIVITIRVRFSMFAGKK